jgi:hypothetical protein
MTHGERKMTMPTWHRFFWELCAPVTLPTGREGGGRSAAGVTSQRSCCNAATPLLRTFAGLTQWTGRHQRRCFEKLAVCQRIVVLPHFPLDFPGTASIAVHVDGPSWVATAWLRDPDFWWCKHREGRCGSRGRRRWPASNPASKQRAQRSIPARRTNRLATVSAHPDGALRRHSQGRRRAGPVQQPSRRLWPPREPPSGSSCRKALRRRRRIRLQSPSPDRRDAHLATGNADRPRASTSARC